MLLAFAVLAEGTDATPRCKVRSATVRRLQKGGYAACTPARRARCAGQAVAAAREMLTPTYETLFLDHTTLLAHAFRPNITA